MGLRGGVGLRTEELAVTTSNRKRHADRKRLDQVPLSRRFKRKSNHPSQATVVGETLQATQAFLSSEGIRKTCISGRLHPC